MSRSLDMRSGALTPFPDELVELYRRKGYWLGLSLDRVACDQAVHNPRRVAVVDGKSRLSYGELEQLVARASAAFRRLGLQKGERVVVQLPNRHEAVVTYLALFRLGAVPVMALPAHRYAELSFFLSHTKASTYITVDHFGDFDYRPLARQLSERCGDQLERVIVLGEALEFESLHALWDREDQLDSTPADSKEDFDALGLALLQLSGGSTAVPKLIPRTHDDYFYSIRRSTELCDFSKDTKYLVALPLAHNFPMSSPGFLGCLFAGGTVVLAEDASPDTVFALFEQEEVTHVAAVPPLSAVWSDAIKARQVSFPSLSVLQVGGARLSEEQAEEHLRTFGCRLQQVFGMAEGLVCYTDLKGSHAHVVQTQGRPMSPDDQVLVVDDSDREIPVGTPGHLLTRGPYTIRGYYMAGQHNARAFTHDGYYRTGDIVRLTSTGELVVVGRSKQQINRGGEKVSPAEVERHLAVHPQVRAVAVVGIPDELRGERIGAFVVRRSGSFIERKEILEHLRERGVATYKIPDEVVFVNELPTTSVGKIDATRLSERLADSVPLLEEIASLTKIPSERIDRNAHLMDLGFDSLLLMTLLERLRLRGVSLSLMDVMEAPTADGIQVLVARHLADKPS